MTAPPDLVKRARDIAFGRWQEGFQSLPQLADDIAAALDAAEAFGRQAQWHEDADNLIKRVAEARAEGERSGRFRGLEDAALIADDQARHRRRDAEDCANDETRMEAKAAQYQSDAIAGFIRALQKAKP